MPPRRQFSCCAAICLMASSASAGPASSASPRTSAAERITSATGATKATTSSSSSKTADPGRTSSKTRKRARPSNTSKSSNLPVAPSKSPPTHQQHTTSSSSSTGPGKGSHPPATKQASSNHNKRARTKEPISNSSTATASSNHGANASPAPLPLTAVFNQVIEKALFEVSSSWDSILTAAPSSTRTNLLYKLTSLQLRRLNKAAAIVVSYALTVSPPLEQAFQPPPDDEEVIGPQPPLSLAIHNTHTKWIAAIRAVFTSVAVALLQAPPNQLSDTSQLKDLIEQAWNSLSTSSISQLTSKPSAVFVYEDEPAWLLFAPPSREPTPTTALQNDHTALDHSEVSGMSSKPINGESTTVPSSDVAQLNQMPDMEAIDIFSLDSPPTSSSHPDDDNNNNSNNNNTSNQTTSYSTHQHPPPSHSLSSSTATTSTSTASTSSGFIGRPLIWSSRDVDSEDEAPNRPPSRSSHSTLDSDPSKATSSLFQAAVAGSLSSKIRKPRAKTKSGRRQRRAASKAARAAAVAAAFSAVLAANPNGTMPDIDDDDDVDDDDDDDDDDDVGDEGLDDDDDDDLLDDDVPSWLWPQRRGRAVPLPLPLAILRYGSSIMTSALLNPSAPLPLPPSQSTSASPSSSSRLGNVPSVHDEGNDISMAEAVDEEEIAASVDDLASSEDEDDLEDQDQEPTFTLTILSSFKWKIDLPGSEVSSSISINPRSSFWLALATGTLTSSLLDLLDALAAPGVPLLYNGTALVDVNIGSERSKRLKLNPSPTTLATSAAEATAEAFQHLSSSTPVPLSVFVEARITLAVAPPLCLDPSPDVARIANAAQFHPTGFAVGASVAAAASAPTKPTTTPVHNIQEHWWKAPDTRAPTTGLLSWLWNEGSLPPASVPTWAMAGQHPGGARGPSAHIPVVESPAILPLSGHFDRLVTSTAQDHSRRKAQIESKRREWLFQRTTHQQQQQQQQQGAPPISQTGVLTLTPQLGRFNAVLRVSNPFGGPPVDIFNHNLSSLDEAAAFVSQYTRLSATEGWVCVHTRVHPA